MKKEIKMFPEEFHTGDEVKIVRPWNEHSAYKNQIGVVVLVSSFVNVRMKNGQLFDFGEEELQKLNK